MGENMRTAATDGLITLFDCVLASNVSAGIPLGIQSASNAVYTLGRDTTGFGQTGLLGMAFIGITDQSYSGSASPQVINVWTKGVFKMYTMGSSSGTNTVSAIGHAVFADSGRTINVGLTAETGDAAIGTFVGRSAGATASSSWVSVKINPARFRWMCYNPAGNTSVSNASLGYPKFYSVGA